MNLLNFVYPFMLKKCTCKGYYNFGAAEIKVFIIILKYFY